MVRKKFSRRHKKKRGLRKNTKNMIIGGVLAIGGFLLHNYASEYAFRSIMSNPLGIFSATRTENLLIYISYALIFLGGWIFISALLKRVK